MSYLLVTGLSLSLFSWQGEAGEGWGILYNLCVLDSCRCKPQKSDLIWIKHKVNLLAHLETCIGEAENFLRVNPIIILTFGDQEHPVFKLQEPSKWFAESCPGQWFVVAVEGDTKEKGLCLQLFCIIQLQLLFASQGRRHLPIDAT